MITFDCIPDYEIFYFAVTLEGSVPESGRLPLGLSKFGDPFCVVVFLLQMCRPWVGYLWWRLVLGYLFSAFRDGYKFDLSGAALTKALQYGPTQG